MISTIIEVTNGTNWGKFMVARFDRAEWGQRSRISGSHTPLLRQIGWGPEHVWVLDLQTGEGACVRPGGSAHADLERHKIWVCPMFEPFLEWLYAYFKGQFQSIEAGLEDIQALPALVALDCPEKSALSGYRRPGPER